LDCHAFEDWLDGGKPDAPRAEALAHARECAACAALSVAEDALGAGLESRWAEPDVAFTERVMQRVATARREALPAVEPELLRPWWTQVLREPEAVLGLLRGGIYAGAGPWLLPWVRAAWPRIAAHPLPGAADFALGWSPIILASLLVPLIGVSAFLLYRGVSAAFARLGAAS